MTHIYLLNALIRQITESRHRRPARLESSEGLRQIVLREVVVAGKALVFCQLVINLGGELIAALMPKRHTLKSVERTAGIERYVGIRHKLSQLVERRLIHALLGNHIARENSGIRHDQIRLCRRHRDRQPATAVQCLGKKICCHSARKR